MRPAASVLWVAPLGAAPRPMLRLDHVGGGGAVGGAVLVELARALATLVASPSPARELPLELSCPAPELPALDLGELRVLLEEARSFLSAPRWLLLLVLASTCVAGTAGFLTGALFAWLAVPWLRPRSDRGSRSHERPRAVLGRGRG